MKLTFTFKGTPLLELSESGNLPTLNYFVKLWIPRSCAPTLRENIRLLNTSGLLTTLNLMLIPLAWPTGNVSKGPIDCILALAAIMLFIYIMIRKGIASLAKNLECIDESLRKDSRTPNGLADIFPSGATEALTDFALRQARGIESLRGGESQESIANRAWEAREHSEMNAPMGEYPWSQADILEWSLRDFLRAWKGLDVNAPSFSDVMREARAVLRVSG